MNFTGLTASLFLLLIPHLANGQKYFLDTFEDGNPTDGSPVSWTHDGGGLDASSGDLVLTTEAGQTMSAFISGNSYSGSIITTKFRLLDTFEQFGQMSRVNSACDGYFSELKANGRLSLFRGCTNVAQIQTNIDPFENDVWMQLISSGDAIMLRAWQDGWRVPVELSITDSTFSSGVAGLWLDPGNAHVSAAVIRSFEVSTVPEPTSAAMLLLGIVIPLSKFRKRRQVD